MNDEQQPKFISIKNARKMLGVTSETLRNWALSGKINNCITPSGVRVYDYEDIQRILGDNLIIPEKEKIAYCRVSSKKQMDDLERQKDFFRNNYPNYTLVTDIGSGINWKRKGLQTILDKAMRGDISEVVVAHRDRLCRFAFELIEYILKQRKVKLVVLDRDDEESSSKDLADDILSIIHVYSCRETGKRRYTKPENKNVSNSSTTENNERMDRNEQICVQSESRSSQEEQRED
jgi:putative resolvase